MCSVQNRTGSEAFRKLISVGDKRLDSPKAREISRDDGISVFPSSRLWDELCVCVGAGSPVDLKVSNGLCVPSMTEQMRLCFLQSNLSLPFPR